MYAILSVVSAFSQGEANNWHFASGAALTFNGGKAKVFAKTQLYAFEGCATISTGTGRFLFFSDGANLYDSTFNITPNGAKLMGQGTCVQSSIFVPKPDSAGNYFLITNFGTLFSLGGIYYSEIDMKLNSGKGDIIYYKKNMLIADSSIEMFTVAKHANGKDYWLIIHKADNDTLCSYLIGSNGISTQPVKSKTGNFINYYNSRGQMKVSADGKKIAWSHMNKFSVLADFDACTGKISNCWRHSVCSYGLDFSQNSRYLYFLYGNELTQFDAKALSYLKYDLSKKVIANSGYDMGSMQLAPDGKIYLPHKDSLSIIHAPDSVGTYCRFEKNALYLKGAVNTYSMPAFVSCFLLKSEVSYSRNCFGDSTFFTYKLRADFDSMHWNFGDSKSGKYNLSKASKNVFHRYSGIGTYFGYMVVYYHQGKDTFRFSLKIDDVKPDLGKDTVYCNSFNRDLFPTRNYLSYDWGNGNKTRFLSVNKEGTYILNALDSTLCRVSDTITLRNAVVKADFEVSDSGQCFLNNSYDLGDRSQYLYVKRKQCTWIFYDGSWFRDSVAHLSFAKTGRYLVKLEAENELGCKDTALKTLEVYPQTPTGFMVNESIQCLRENHFDFINLNNDSLKTTYTWFLGDRTPVTKKSILGKTFGFDTTLTVIMVAKTVHTCIDTFKQNVSVLESPTADFIWGKACNLSPIQFQYNGSSPIYEYRWVFEDLFVSQLANPSKLINKIGVSRIYLQVTNSMGCKDSITQFVNVKEEAKADFIVHDYCDGDSVVFTNTSPVAKSFLWKFGDGLRSSKPQPKHLYQIAGTSKTFNVTLVANIPNGCEDSIIKSLSVSENPNSDFTYNLNGFSIDFQAKHTNYSNYIWYFGDGDSFSGINNALHLYKLSPLGLKVCLKTKNAADCFSETCKVIGLSKDRKILEKLIGFKLIPNPNNGKFILYFDQLSPINFLEVFNLEGQLVYKQEFNRIELELNLLLKPGLYLVKVTNEDKFQVQRMLVVK